MTDLLCWNGITGEAQVPGVGVGGEQGGGGCYRSLRRIPSGARKGSQIYACMTASIKSMKD